MKRNFFTQTIVLFIFVITIGAVFLTLPQIAKAALYSCQNYTCANNTVTANGVPYNSSSDATALSGSPCGDASDYPNPNCSQVCDTGSCTWGSDPSTQTCGTTFTQYRSCTDIYCDQTLSRSGIPGTLCASGTCNTSTGVCSGGGGGGGGGTGYTAQTQQTCNTTGTWDAPVASSVCVAASLCTDLTPTPTPIPCTDTSFNSCGLCTGTGRCGWTTSPSLTGNYCQSGTNVCPVGRSTWYWNPVDCSTNNNICAPPPTPTPTGIPPAPTYYSISGKIFTDTNRDGLSAGDTNYPGTFTVSSTGGIVSYGNGTFQISNLPAGSYTVTFGGLASGYRFTYPQTPGNALIVNVGSSCIYPTTSEGMCTAGSNCINSAAGCSGSISNLNAGVTNIANMWFQSVGSDMRWDAGFIDPIPATATNAFASIAVSGGMPGIIFSGKSTPDFGSGNASQKLWKVGSPANPDVFTTTHNLITTSYTYLSETANGSGITPITLTTLSSSIAHGIYKTNANTDLTINSPVTFGSGNFIILVDGNLNINANITVPVGSTAIFSAKGNITVGANVAQIQGLYSADGTFTVNGVSSCAGNPAVAALNVAGSVIANAGRGGGTFNNKRDLCAANSTTPSVTFTERPDFMLNYPSFVQQIHKIWQEVAP